MIKKNILFILLFFLLTTPTFAEKTPVKIAPAQIISTNHDEIEVGDWVNFETVNDVYVNGNLYIKKNTPLYGFVDFVHPNGWVGDSAEVRFKIFETSDLNGKKVIINYPLILNGNNSKNNAVKQYFAIVFLRLIRGAEMCVEPDTKIFNIFIEQ